MKQESSLTQGAVAPFQALSSTLSTIVGLSNIAGVTVAISLGGLGATFWVVVAVFFRMFAKFAAGIWAAKYHNNIAADGAVHHESTYSLSKKLAEKGILSFGKGPAIFFALVCMGVFLSENRMLQANPMQILTMAHDAATDIPLAAKIIVEILIAISVVVALFGGVKRITQVSEKIMLFMAILYLGTGLAIVAINMTDMPTVMGLIFAGAFTIDAIIGGFIGMLIITFPRAAFSNETAVEPEVIAVPTIDTAPSTNKKAPALVESLLESFIDIIIIFITTALAIVVTNIDGQFLTYDTKILEGVGIAASEPSLPGSSYLLTMAVVLFAFLTIIFLPYYTLQIWKYIYRKSALVDMAYKVLFGIFTLVGSVASFIILMAFFFTTPILRYQTKPQNPPEGCVTVEGTQFKINGQSYRFVGTNFWYGMHLGVPKHRDRLIRELDKLQEIGCNNLRITISSEGPLGEPFRVQPPLMLKPLEYDEEILEGLDFLLVEMAKRKIYGVLVLGNFWHWSGGFAQYVAWSEGTTIPYPILEGGDSWGRFMDYTFSFYSNERARNWFSAYIKKIVERTNTITGKPYTGDPTIMSWQLANEPKCGPIGAPYTNWVRESAKLIRKLDPHHLISSGSEGLMSEWMYGNRRRNFIKNHGVEIDYLTTHIWVQNWDWYNPKKPNTLAAAQKKAIEYLDKHIDIATKMKLPLVLEEFGIGRDAESYAANTPTTIRDSYYKFMFEYLEKNINENSPYQAINFWAWGGEGRPRIPRAIYEPGDDLIGDPPHEYQGWYSVYNTDTTTLELIKTFNEKFQK